MFLCYLKRTLMHYVFVSVLLSLLFGVGCAKTENKFNTLERTLQFSCKEVFSGDSQKEIWSIPLSQIRENIPGIETTLASLQGLLNRVSPRVWMHDKGMSDIILNELRSEGWIIKNPDAKNLWTFIRSFGSEISGAILYDESNDSINAAFNVAAVKNAIVVSKKFIGELENSGIPILVNASDFSESKIFQKYHSKFKSHIAIEQSPLRRFQLRDFAIFSRAFNFYDSQAENQKKYFDELGPFVLVFGWGKDEYNWVSRISSLGGVTVPAEFSLNLSALPCLPTKIPSRNIPKAKSPEEGERIISFVISDGDNISWVGSTDFVDNVFFWQSPIRNEIPITWEMNPILAKLAPRYLSYFYRNAGNNGFVASSSGIGYAFPGIHPESQIYAQYTGDAMRESRLSIMTMINSGGNGMDDARIFLENPNIDAVLYKDFHAYHLHEGAIRWHKGKPIIGYMGLLWENMGETPKPHLRNITDPSSLAKEVAKLPSSPTDDPRSYAVIGVHAWSWENKGGPLEAIKETIKLLPKNTRVVLVEQLVQMLTENFKDKL